MPFVPYIHRDKIPSLNKALRERRKRECQKDKNKYCVKYCKINISLSKGGDRN